MSTAGLVKHPRIVPGIQQARGKDLLSELYKPVLVPENNLTSRSHRYPEKPCQFSTDSTGECQRHKVAANQGAKSALGMCSGVGRPGFKSWLCYLLAGGPRAPFLNLSASPFPPSRNGAHTFWLARKLAHLSPMLN